jgi:hypothetical protein
MENYMKIFATVFFLSLVLSQSSSAAIQSTGGDDILVDVSSKLSEINQRLKDQRVFVSSAVVKWPEYEKFQSNLIFSVAHDPHGFIDNEVPSELNPKYLTQKLKESWIDLEVSASQLGEQTKSSAWIRLKAQVEEFFNLRDKAFYQPARKLVSSGEIIASLKKVNDSALDFLKQTQTSKHVSVKIIDPVIEKMSRELSVINRSVRELVSFKTPPPVLEPAFLKRIHANELFAVAGGGFFAGLFICVTFLWLKSRTSKVQGQKEEKVVVNSFNYYEWLKRLELNLHALKDNEDNTCEEYIKLKELSEKLHLSRKYLNQADNQQDYYKCLEELNVASPKIEEYFEKVNLRKNSEISRRVIKQIIQLCDAIESKKVMSFEDEKPKLKLIQQEKLGQFNAA